MMSFRPKSVGELNKNTQTSASVQEPDVFVLATGVMALPRQAQTPY